MIHQRLSYIFPDAIILDMQYTILSVSSSILTLLKYSEGELVGKKITALAPQTPDLEANLRSLLSDGHFHDFNVSLQAGCKRTVLATLSGFNFHLLSSTGDCIVLKINSMEELHRAHFLLQQKTAELDYYLYRASHDLRGPIASIQGIVNLANLRKDDSEVNLFFDLISINIEQLDQELRKLVKKYQAIP